MWRRAVCWVATDVSEEHIASIFRVEENNFSKNQQASRINCEPFSGAPGLFSCWLGDLVHGCWRLHSDQPIEPSSIFHLPSVSYIYTSFPARRLFCLPPAYLLVLAEIIFFDPENGGDMLLRNVGCNSTDYTASDPRRWYSSGCKVSQTGSVPAVTSRWVKASHILIWERKQVNFRNFVFCSDYYKMDEVH
jgi:hypothetical protein